MQNVRQKSQIQKKKNLSIVLEKNRQNSNFSISTVEKKEQSSAKLKKNRLNSLWKRIMHFSPTCFDNL